MCRDVDDVVVVVMVVVQDTKIWKPFLATNASLEPKKERKDKTIRKVTNILLSDGEERSVVKWQRKLM
jgi:hypothetical protein